MNVYVWQTFSKEERLYTKPRPKPNPNQTQTQNGFDFIDANPGPLNGILFNDF